MSSVHDAGSMMHIHPNIAIHSYQWLAGMDANSHSHSDVLRPKMAGEGALEGDGCRDGIGGTCKGDEEGIPLCIDFVAVVVGKHHPQEVTTVCQYTGVMVTQALEEACGPLDIAEKQGNRPCRQVASGRSLSHMLV